MLLTSIKDQSLVDKEKFLIKGGLTLKGTVRTSPAKNAVLKQMAACLLVPGEVILEDVPPLRDVLQMIEILRFLGAECEFLDDEASALRINCAELSSHFAPFELVSKLRASFVVLGPLLARLHKAKISLPGGCQIGSRRIDLHIKGLALLGASLETNHGYIDGKLIDGLKSLEGSEIHLDLPSNGATENIMMAAVLAKGKTVMQNAAKDPEIEDLANFLNACGAQIKGAGTDCIEIEGCSLEKLHGIRYRSIPDRIEAGTFLLAALATRGKIIVENAIPKHLSALISKLRESGAQIEADSENRIIHIDSPEAVGGLEINTVWYPGFSTDLQPQMTAMLTKASASSSIKESIYEDRFSYVEELVRMGAQIQLNNKVALITGVDNLSGAVIRGGDLRATAALIIAALSADGESEVYGLHHLDRGYSHFEEKLRGLGASVERLR